MIIPIYNMKQFDEIAVDPWQKRLIKKIRICPFCTPDTRMAIHFGNNPYDTWSFCLKCKSISYVWDDSRGRRQIRSTLADHIPNEVQAMLNEEVTGMELAMERCKERETIARMKLKI